MWKPLSTAGRSPARRGEPVWSVCSAGDRVVAIDHGSLSAHALEGAGWVRWVSRAATAFHPVGFSAAADRLYALDHRGELWHAPEGGPFESLMPVGCGPGARAEASLVWDGFERRLLLFAGREDSWVYDGSWRRIAAPGALPNGVGRAVSTPSGVYLLVAGQLWLLRGNAWNRVTGPRARTTTALLFDPRRSLLLAVGDDLAVLDRGVWLPWTELGSAAHPGDGVGLDPIGDRLVLLRGSTVHELPLATIFGTACA